jgi:hypothetical protein
MDHEKEIYSLSAETFALTTIIANVFSRLSQTDARLAAAIKRGVDDAASQVENIAISLGKAASPEHTVKALRIIEEMRKSIGDQDKPRHGV